MDHGSEDAQPCAFPACGAAAKKAYALDLALCSRHRALVLDDPAEFRRLWGTLEPRPGPPASPSRAPGRPQAPLPPAAHGA